MQSFDFASLRPHRLCHFVVRSDHAIKPGGDIDLAHQLSRTATAAGASVVVAAPGDLGEISADDALFLFNIDRPFDASAALAHAPAQTRALLYTLHHPQPGIERYLCHGVGGAKRLLARLAGNQPDRYEALIDLAKGALARDPARMIAGARRKQVIRALIDRCELLVVDPGELAAIEARHGSATRPAALLLHPVASHAPHIGQHMLRYVLVPGRIEPRKNQLAALKALAAIDIRARGLEIAVVGGKGSDAGYYQEVIDFCLANRILYLSHLPKALFLQAVSSADVVINASYFEVTSLIDLYALRYDIPLVTTQFGYYSPAPHLAQLDPLAWQRDHHAVAAAIDQVLAPQ